jgi:amidase
MQRITRDRDHLHLLWDPTLPPLATLRVGESIAVETADNFGLFREIDSAADLVDRVALHQLNPITGPIAVEGAEPGDTLVLELLAVHVADRGHICLVPGTGILRNRIQAPHTHVWRIENGMAVFDDNLRYPIRPIVGTFGSMPAEDGIHAIYPGSFGGNLDDGNLVAGSVYYLPVNVPGGMVMVGDVHANQGDAEVAMGIEIDGEVVFRVRDLLKGAPLPYARIETAERWIFPADAPTLEEAVERCAILAAGFLVERLGISLEDAAHLLSAFSDIRISQSAFAGYNVTVRAEVPKAIDLAGRLSGYL